MVAVHDLLEALSSMGIAIEARNGRLYYRPRSALTPDLLSAVKSCKAELLKVLPSSSLLPEGSDAGEQRAAGVRAALSPDSIPQSRCDAEFDRFAAIAKPMPGGGWYDPIHGAPEMPSGVPGDDWDAFVRNCGNLGKGVQA